MFLPKIVPTRFNGMITNTIMQAIAICHDEIRLSSDLPQPTQTSKPTMSESTEHCDLYMMVAQTADKNKVTPDEMVVYSTKIMLLD